MRKHINAIVIALVRMSVFLDSIIYLTSLEFKTNSTEKNFHSGHSIMLLYITG